MTSPFLLAPQGSRRPGFALLFLLALCGSATAAAASAPASGGWPMWGNGALDTRSAPDETKLGPASVPRLQKQWRYTAGGNVSATPTVDASGVYFPDWGGFIQKVDPHSGSLIWKHRLSEYTGNTHRGLLRSFSRNSPALSDKLAIFGDQGSATVIAVDKSTGALVWKTVLDTKSTARITASPTVLGDHVYVGVSSFQEITDIVPRRPPDFRGSVAALDLNTGAVQWQVYTVPKGYTGGAVWGSSLVPDTSRGLLYVTTGNDYSVPPDVAICTQTALTQAQQLQCMAPDNYVDAVLALDLNSGAVRWDDRLQGADAWDFPCFLGPQAANCPTPSGPDYDFGAGVNFIDTVDAAGKPLQLIGAGEKSGMYWALNPDNGQVVWRTRVGPGGLDGGMEWGSATDGKRVYVAIADLELRKYQLGPDYKTEHRGGSWAALDAATGAVIWQVPETGKNPLVPSLPAASSAALTVANGVVYAGSQSGDMVALDAATGATLWKYHTRGTVMDGPSVVDGWLYWGSGYNNLVITGKPDNKVYAFALP